MGSRGAKSKRTRRNNALKRKILMPLYRKKAEKINYINKMQQRGMDMLKTQPKNAFKYPNDPEAVFPQKVPQPIIDLRSASNIETIIELKFEKAKRRQQGRGITTISRAKMAAQAALEKPVDEAKEEAKLIQAMSRMILKDEVKVKRGPKKTKNGMAMEGGNKIRKSIKKGRKKRRNDKTFRQFQ